MKLYGGVEVDLGLDGLLTDERRHLEGIKHLVYACLNVSAVAIANRVTAPVLMCE